MRGQLRLIPNEDDGKGPRIMPSAREYAGRTPSHDEIVSRVERACKRVGEPGREVFRDRLISWLLKNHGSVLGGKSHRMSIKTPDGNHTTMEDCSRLLGRTLYMRTLPRLLGRTLYMRTLRFVDSTWEAPLTDRNYTVHLDLLVRLDVEFGFNGEVDQSQLAQLHGMAEEARKTTARCAPGLPMTSAEDNLDSLEYALANINTPPSFRTKVAFEAKVGPQSLGDLFRQLRTYGRLFNGLLCVASDNDSGRALIEEQGFPFFLVRSR